MRACGASRGTAQFLISRITKIIPCAVLHRQEVPKGLLWAHPKLTGGLNGRLMVDLYHAVIVQTDRQKIDKQLHEAKNAVALRLESLDFSRDECHYLAKTSAALLVLEHQSSQSPA